MTPDIKSLRHSADQMDAEMRSLEARYGTGSRPAWVGEEIGILHSRANFAREKADEMEGALTQS